MTNQPADGTLCGSNKVFPKTIISQKHAQSCFFFSGVYTAGVLQYITVLKLHRLMAAGAHGHLGALVHIRVE